MDEGPSSQDTLSGEPFQGSVLLQPDEEGYSSQDTLPLLNRPRKKKKLIHRAKGKDAQEKAAEDFQAKASQVDGGVLDPMGWADEEGYSSQEFLTFCDDFEKVAEDSQAKNSEESLLNRPLEKKKLIHKAKGNDALRSFSSRAEEHYSQFSSRAYSQFEESQAKNSQLDQEVDHWIKSIEASPVEPSLPSQPRTRKARPLKPEPESPARS
jgi:hypothetical protein